MAHDRPHFQPTRFANEVARVFSVKLANPKLTFKEAAARHVDARIAEAEKQGMGAMEDAVRADLITSFAIAAQGLYAGWLDWNLLAESVEGAFVKVPPTDKYLQLREGVWYFRIRVPNAIRDKVGVGEIRRSLYTEDKSDARVQAAQWAAKVRPIFRKLRPAKEVVPDHDALITQLEDICGG